MKTTLSVRAFDSRGVFYSGIFFFFFVPFYSFFGFPVVAFAIWGRGVRSLLVSVFLVLFSVSCTSRSTALFYIPHGIARWTAYGLHLWLVLG